MQESDDHIAIDVMDGKYPGAPDACTEEARHASLLIETQQPIGDRDIVVLAETALSS